jgi:gliding motility-associated-like protein
MTSDPESNNVFVESITSSSPNGTFSNGPATDLCFTFTPALDFNGVVYADVNICDDGSPVSCLAAVVEITVVPVNDAPVAVDDDYSGNEDDILVGNVLDNDSDPDGDLLIVDATPVDPPVSGTLVLNADGSFTYTPATDFAGQDTFTYSVCDDGDPSLCAQAIVTITLNDLEDPVVAYQLLTPNDDAFNDEWVVDGIEQFPQNNVQIFDRWSALVYKTDGYNNRDRVWKGEANVGISPDELPNGTYFYVIQLGDGSSPLQGFVELKR